MSPLDSKAFPLGAALLLTALASCAGPGDLATARVHNQRPFVSRDTVTTPENVLETELGAAIDPGDRLDLPVFLKYGLGPRTELYGGLSIFSRVDSDGGLPEGSGVGDSLIGFRHRLAERTAHSPAVAFDLATKLPTGRPGKGIGTGEMDWLASIQGTQHFQENIITGYYQLGLLGEVQDSGMDLRHTGAFQGRRPLDSRFSALGELSGIWEPERDRIEGGVLLGLSYLINSHSLFDFGLRLGIGSDAPSVQIVFGLTRTLGLLDFPDNAGETP